MPNRSERPPIKPLNGLQLPPIEEIRLDNDLPLFVINQGTQEIIKLEILFNAGRPFEHKPLAAKTTAALLKGGSSQYNASTIAELMDYYGSNLKSPVDMDCPSLVLYTLNKHFSKVLPIVASLLQEPTFPKVELDHYIEQQCRRLEIELSKTEVVAYRAITEQIFGSDHPYGYNSAPALYQDLTRQDIQDHFQSFYHAGNAKIILSGYVTEREIDLLRATLSKLPSKAAAKPKPMQRQADHQQHLQIDFPEAIQTSVRMGFPLFNRAHPKYSEIYFLNTLLGGFFGSRLMNNIREDKGYTYNIYSSLDCMRYDGCWLISSEVSNEKAQQTYEEIRAEIQALQQDLVEEEELSMVKNYIMGVLLSMLDGPLNIAEIVKSMLVAEADLSIFEKLVQTTQNISPTEIRSLFQEYLPLDKLYSVSVGPKAF